MPGSRGILLGVLLLSAVIAASVGIARLECGVVAVAGPEPQPAGGGASEGAQVEVPPRGVVHMDVWCDFPVRKLLREPARVPRLWGRLSSALLHVYSVEQTALTDLRARSLPQQCLPMELWVLDRRPAQRLPVGNIRVVDGLLTPSLRALADLGGDPVVPAFTPEDRKSLRERLQLGAIDDDWPAWRDRLRLGGFQLLGGSAEGAIHDAAARTVLAAQAEFDAAHDRGAGIATTVSVTLGHAPGSEERVWEDFMAALELLSVRFADLSYDIWFWGHAEQGDGCQALRLRWGHPVVRGKVVHATLPASRQHRVLRTADLSVGKSNEAVETQAQDAARAKQEEQ